MWSQGVSLPRDTGQWAVPMGTLVCLRSGGRVTAVDGQKQTCRPTSLGRCVGLGPRATVESWPQGQERTAGVILTGAGVCGAFSWDLFSADFHFPSEMRTPCVLKQGLFKTHRCTSPVFCPALRLASQLFQMRISAWPSACALPRHRISRRSVGAPDSCLPGSDQRWMRLSSE